MFRIAQTVYRNLRWGFVRAIYKRSLAGSSRATVGRQANKYARRLAHGAIARPLGTTTVAREIIHLKDISRVGYALVLKSAQVVIGRVSFLLSSQRSRRYRL